MLRAELIEGNKEMRALRFGILQRIFLHKPLLQKFIMEADIDSIIILFKIPLWIKGETRTTEDLIGGHICLATAYNPAAGKTLHTCTLC